jgi:8-oxo-dGTP diphosphatase
MKVNYVVGFLFSDDLSKVVLIRKARPEWQKGLLNGPGGKIEKGETPVDAMYREFYEEAGVEILVWKYAGQMVFDEKTTVAFFVARRGDPVKLMVAGALDEPVDWYPVVDIEKLNTVPNLRWLIPLCKLKLEKPDWKEVGTFVTG